MNLKIDLAHLLVVTIWAIIFRIQFAKKKILVDFFVQVCFIQKLIHIHKYLNASMYHRSNLL